MIVILCDSFSDAIDSYYLFLGYLEENEMRWCPCRCFDDALMIDTDEDLRYLFIDYKYKNLIFKKNNKEIEFIEKEVFFEDLFSSEDPMFV